MSGAITTQNNARLERLLTTAPSMERLVRAAIGRVLARARRDVSSAAAAAMRSDPRKAAQAVRRTVYRQVLGGNINILNKKRHGGMAAVPSSSRGRLKRTEQIMGYQGSDRGFILRFVNAGTAGRTAAHMNAQAIRRTEKDPSRQYRTGRIGGRGAITGRNFFTTAATRAIQAATAELEKEFERIITEQSK